MTRWFREPARSSTLASRPGELEPAAVGQVLKLLGCRSSAENLVSSGKAPVFLDHVIVKLSVVQIALDNFLKPVRGFVAHRLVEVHRQALVRDLFGVLKRQIKEPAFGEMNLAIKAAIDRSLGDANGPG